MRFEKRGTALLMPRRCKAPVGSTGIPLGWFSVTLINFKADAEEYWRETPLPPVRCFPKGGTAAACTSRGQFVPHSMSPRPKALSDSGK
jgi:hypothetical protein